jgi:hypothetical protein
MSKQIAEFNEFATQLKEFETKYDNVVYDMDDKKANKQARSDQRSIGSIVAKVEVARKDAKAPYKLKCDEIDAEGKSLTTKFRDIQAKIKTQIAAHEEKVKAEEEALLKKLTDIRDFKQRSLFSNTSEEVKELITELANIGIDDSYKHLEQPATEEREIILEEMKMQYGKVLQSEKDAKELQALREAQAKQAQIDHDKRIAEEAAERARIASEKAAQDKIDAANAEALRVKQEAEKAILDAKVAEEKAKQDLIDAEANIEREKAQAIEDARIKDEEAKAIIAVEEACKQAEIKAKKAKIEHIEKIHSEAVASFIGHGLSQEGAGRMVELIATKGIEHISIDY